jgi:polar amino acid transport system substrate-binding protein
MSERQRANLGDERARGDRVTRNTRWLVVFSAIVLCLVSACSAPQDSRASAAIQVLDIPPLSATYTAGAEQSLCTDDPPVPRLPEPGHMPASSRMAVIRARGYLIVGVDQNTMLLGYFNPTDNAMEGFEVEIARQIAYAIFGDRKPERVHFTAVLTAQRTDVVKDGRVDLVVDAITMTCRRSKDVDFSTIYFMAHQRTMVRKTSSARDLHDLKGHKVCATNTSTALSLLLNGDYGVTAYPVLARTDCLVALQTGVVDGIQTDDAILYGLHAQDPYTKILDQPPLGYTDEPYGIAINKAYPGFVDFVNGVLARMRQSDTAAAPFRTWRSLYEQFLTPVRGGGPPTPPMPRRCRESTSCRS